MKLKHVALPALLATLALSSTALAQPPTGAEVEKLRPNRPLLYAGLGTIAASYIPPVLVAATSDRAADRNLFIPVAGPWLDLADRPTCAPNSCETEGVYKTLLVTTGLAHLVGTGLVVSSFLVPEERTRITATPTKPVVMPARMGQGGFGLMVSGAF